MKGVNKRPENLTRCKINVSKILQSDQYFLGILPLIFHLFYFNFFWRSFYYYVVIEMKFVTQAFHCICIAHFVNVLQVNEAALKKRHEQG